MTTGEILVVVVPFAAALIYGIYTISNQRLEGQFVGLEEEDVLADMVESEGESASAPIKSINGPVA